jgi:hypothetical protein
MILAAVVLLLISASSLVSSDPVPASGVPRPRQRGGLSSVPTLSSPLIPPTCKGVNQFNFMHRCWCEVGYEHWNATNGDPLESDFPNEDGSGEPLLNCTQPIWTIGGCDCEIHDTERSFLKNASWKHPGGPGVDWPYRCEALCRSNSQVGVPFADRNEWSDNQIWKQLGFYKKELHQTRHNHLRARLDEFAVGFGQWTYLENVSLGHVIEFGAGGYTQIRNIMERVPSIKLSSLMIVDPLVDHYKTMKNCPYGTGTMVINNVSYPTTLSNLTIEQYAMAHKPLKKFDTVIVMNVLVYAMDAFAILNTIYDSLQHGGLLIFHDRWFLNPAVSSKCKTSGFLVDLIQVSKHLLDHFMGFFDHSPFLSTNKTEGQISRALGWCHGKDDEQGYWAVVRKI